jgi:hypothetical protein
VLARMFLGAAQSSMRRAMVMWIVSMVQARMQVGF